MTYEDDCKIEMVKIHHTYAAVRKLEEIYGKPVDHSNIMRNLPTEQLTETQFITGEY